jgi:dipeptidyl aminopeptidase/acylaminoacyl peptidase
MDFAFDTNLKPPTMQTHMRFLPRPLAAAVLLLCLAPVAFFAAEPAPARTAVTAADLLKIRQLGAVALSPDGRQIVYTVKTIVEKPGKPGEYAYQTHLWLAAADGGVEPRQLTQGEAAASAPQWSPDGRRVAFVRNVGEKPQIWILPLADGGEAFALTQLETGAANPRWSPDGRSIAFTSSLTATDVRKALAKAPAASPQPGWPSERANRAAGDTADWFDKTKDAVKPAATTDGSRQEQREWLAQNEADGNPRLITRLAFLGESDLEPQLHFDNLCVIEAHEGAKPVALTPGFRRAQEPAWAPDGQSIAFTTEPDAEHDPDREEASVIESVRPDGTGRTRLLALTGQKLSAPQFSPDGKTLAFLAQDVVKDPGYAQVRVGFKPLAPGATAWLAESFDRSAANLRWSADGQHAYFTAASNGGFPLYRLAPRPGAQAERLTDCDTGVGAFDVSRERLAYVLTQPTDPYEVGAADLLAHSPRVLTSHNSAWLAGRNLSAPERRSLTRPDGTALDVWLIKPAHFDPAKKYPLLVEIHGGPSAMWGPGEATMWHEFQFFAARGYAIAFCNPRGSGGYGHAFERANFQNWGPGPGGDVLAAADLAAREPWVDASRQVVTGGSYGGYLTAWLVTQDHRFKAAAAVRGVYDLATFFGEGNAWRLVPYHFGGYPWQKNIRAILEANSSTTFVDQITTPLLIKHGDTDFRTGIVQSEMLYKALKVLGKPVEYARYPRATHELSRSGEPHQRLDRLVRFEEFFRRFIGEN